MFTTTDHSYTEQALGDSVAPLNYEDLPERSVETVTRAFVDIIGVTLRVGAASHAPDYDDLSWVTDGHPSVTLVPPLLALAEEADADGVDPAEVKRVTVEAEPGAADALHDADPDTGLEAKFSTEYCVKECGRPRPGRHQGVP